MPIQNKDLGKYKRPGIFINEIDKSTIDTPPIQDVLVNLVPGFSKKGPVNTPVYITSKKNFKDIFGDIDKGLERKGSYFHRTCYKMIESGPIWALNLLMTNDDRDKANWKSVSCAANFSNDITKNMPYSRLFNRQDFWMRDSESFLDYVNDPQADYNRLLHLSNLGNKVTTTFIFKSKITGFDITAEDWYGGPTKVPSYINAKDWISDYMVSVLILDGDWTNYDVLKSDALWGKYFTPEGLDKTRVQDFVDEPSVTTLGYYEASLIPYFKDINGRDMYVKSLINKDTDRTGLFCAYFEDEMLDSEFPIGKVDLIGSGIVGSVKTDIEFLSYKETIAEEVIFGEKKLNTLGNTFGNYSTDLTQEFVGDREGFNTNHYVNGMTIVSGATSNFNEINNITGFVGTTDITLDSATSLEIGDIVFFNKDYDTIKGFDVSKPYYILSVVGGTTITVSETYSGPVVKFTAGTISDMYISSTRKIYSVLGTDTYFNLANTKYSLVSGATDFQLQLDSIKFDDLSQNIERYDVLYLSRGNDADIKVMKGEESLISVGADKPYFTLDYNDNLVLGYVKVQLSAGTLSNEYMPITVDDSGYIPLDDIIVSGGTTTVEYLKLTFNNTGGLTNYNDYKQLRYRNAYTEIEGKLDDGRGVIINKNDSSKYQIELDKFSSIGYSNTQDAQIMIYGIDYTNYSTSSSDFLLHYLDDEFITTGDFVKIKSDLTLPTSEIAIAGKYSAVYENYYNGVINNGDYVNPFNDKTETTIDNNIYLTGYFNDDLLTIDFSGPIIRFNETTDPTYNSMLIVHSNDSNYKQSVDISELVYTGPIDLTKIYTIKVDKNRYSELIKGSFLTSYYNEDELEYGQAPKTLARVIKVENDLVNSDLKILTCDGPILCSTSLGDGGYTTMTYPTIEEYVSTYKGIKLVPFVISTESIPNKTEVRQSNILDLLLPSTNLGKGLINKNKIQWRYLVDSFGLGLTSKSKQQYTDLCGEKLNSLGFISAPSVKDFKNSSSPSFVNDDMTLNTDYLVTGGDETKNPAFLYSFAEGVGRSTVGYFFPYVTVSDAGVPKNVPPAAWIASTYMKKFLSSSSAIQPWTIAAGVSNGRVTGIGGVEMDLGNTDLENLYTMGLNPIVKTRLGQYIINSESTAQVFPYSSLSVIHSREVLIELENALYNMLLRYQWRFNTGAIRAEIKYKADKICQDIQNRDGLYDFKNVIDETNNTNYIIDLQMGTLDTFVEIIKGMGIIVNNITILKKGDIQSGGFL